ncbi:MAG TPA: SRPBCC domain-containing protein [Verrucomicrobiae bacterium]|nr:SRPBCC domain-containing protein [Verrucomicrobiae bacterium]
MTTQNADAENISLQVRRGFNAPREVVFDFWTKPERMRTWFCPAEFSPQHAEADLRPGGAYSIQMRQPDGELLTALGVYREVRKPERLVFTWAGWRMTRRERQGRSHW